MGHSEDNLSITSRKEGIQRGQRAPRLRALIVALLYLLLVTSAGLALWAKRFPGQLPQSLEFAAPILFMAFVVIFTLYRLRLVRAQKYPAFKAFFQIGAAVLFFTLLLPHGKSLSDSSLDGIGDLLASSDPRVRALAAEVVGCRSEPKYGSFLVKALADPDEHVREQAHRSLVHLSGQDLGDPRDEKALKAWGERFP